jgi:carboxypeptidase D
MVSSLIWARWQTFAISAAMAIGLLGTPAAAQGSKTAADYFVHSLPGQPDGPLVKMHAGYVLERTH